MSRFAKMANRVPLAPFAALVFGGAATVLVFLAPVWRLEGWVEATGLPNILAAAQAPLGTKARIMLSAMAALAVALPVFVVLRRFEGKGRKVPVSFDIRSKVEPIKPFVQEREEPIIPVPEGRRRPIIAHEELGAPFMTPSETHAAPTAPEYEPPVADYHSPVSQTELPVAEYHVPEYKVPDYSVEDYQLPTSSVDHDLEIGAYEQQVASEAQMPAWTNPVAESAANKYAEPDQWYQEAYAPAAQPIAETSVEDELFLEADQIADIPEPVAVVDPVAEMPAAWMVPENLSEEPSQREDLPYQIDGDRYFEAGPVWGDGAADVQPPLAPIVEAVAPVTQPVWEQPVGEVHTPSVAELVGRLETGIRRRQLANLVSAPSGVLGQSTDAAADAALRDALGTLERLAANVR